MDIKYYYNKLELSKEFDDNVIVIVNYTPVRELYIKNTIRKQNFKNVIFWNDSMSGPLPQNINMAFFQYQTFKVMNYLHNISDSFKWALVLEDDAHFYFGFKYKLMHYLITTSDIVWLDTRTSTTVPILGYPTVGTVGVLYNLKTITQFEKIYSNFYNSDNLFQKIISTQIDFRLSIFCQYNIIKWSAIPLIGEYGFKSSFGNVMGYAPPKVW
jgi:hypothetical protein